MESFPRLKPSDSLGGLYEFFYVDIRNVVSVPRPVGPAIKQDIVLKTGAKWGRGIAAAETARFQEPDGLDEHGIFYMPKLSGTYPRDNEIVANLFAQLIRSRYLVLYRPNILSQFKLAGTKKTPLRFSYELDTSAKVAGENGYSFLFSERAIRESLWYEGNFEVGDEGSYSGGGPGGGSENCPTLTQQIGTHANAQIKTAIAAHNKSYAITEGLVVLLSAAQMKAILVNTGIAAPVIGQFTNNELIGFGVIFPTLSARIAENLNSTVSDAINNLGRAGNVAEHLIDNHLTHNSVIGIINDNAGLEASVRAYYGTKDDYIIEIPLASSRSYAYAHVTQRNSVISGLTVLTGQGNFTSVIHEKNGVVQNSYPFSVARGDRMKVEFVGWNGEQVTAKILGSISDSLDNAAAIDALPNNGRYLFCWNIGNTTNTFSKIDLQTGIIINSGTIATSMGAMFYNPVTNLLFIGNDAQIHVVDPANMTVSRTITLPASVAGWGATYDTKRHGYWISRSNAMAFFNPITETISNTFILANRNGLSYIPSLDIIFPGSTNQTIFHLADDATFGYTVGGTQVRSTAWVQTFKKLYGSGNNAFNIYNAINGKLVLETVVFANVNRGTCFYHAATGCVFSSSFNADAIAWIDTVTNLTGSLAVPKLVGEGNAFDMVYSNHDNHYYLRLMNSERILAFDPINRVFVNAKHITNLPASAATSEAAPFSQIITDKVHIND
jgi:hypothetical protein